MKFKNFDIQNDIKKALNKMGMHTPTDIQDVAIPEILANSKTHFIAQAKTGTGKTLAFAIPLFEMIDSSLEEVQAVIMAPTRELVTQIYDVLYDLNKYKRLKLCKVYGGVSIDRQINLIEGGAQIIIATPGRIIDIYKRGKVSFDNMKYFVLDEADRMLDMGFIPDIEFLLFEAMKEVYPRLYLFSATMPEEIVKVAESYAFDWGDELIEIKVSSDDDLTVQNCDQYFYQVEDREKKYNKFVKILQKERPESCIVFVNTKHWGDILKRLLIRDKRVKMYIGTLNGNMSQRQREKTLEKFRQGKIDCLVATNVAARGLDIPRVTHVFNYDIPEGKPEVYVHRIGRTSRMKSEGKAIALVEREQLEMLYDIEHLINKQIQRYYLDSQEKNRHKNLVHSSSKTAGKQAKKEFEFVDKEAKDVYADVSIYG